MLRHEIEHLVMLASCAPSVHNTQPWRLTAVDDGLVVRRDAGRLLGVIDPAGREQLISCGAMLHHLQVAARAMAVDADVLVNAHDDDVARVRFHPGEPASEAEVSAAVAILHRHTYRGRFTPEPVRGHDLDLVRLAAEAQGGLVRVVHEDELVQVEVLVSRAQEVLRVMPGYQQELERWVWHRAVDDDTTRGDGVPQEALDHASDRAESLESRDFDGPRPVPTEPPVAEHPILVLLSSATDSPADWVQAGRALSALLLRATEIGLLAQPIGQALDLPASRYTLGQVLGTVGSPQMLLRLGHGTSAPTTPRRLVADVLTF